MTWERGLAAVERLISDGKLERVAPSGTVGSRLIMDAEAHVRLAGKGTGVDPAGALQLAYDSARKATAALLAVQGLRATAGGGHVAVIAAARSQFEDKGGSTVFARINRLRRRRHASEYPAPDSPGVTPADAEEAISLAKETIDFAKKLLAAGALDPFL